MSAPTDTPLKRFTAFWVTLGAFLLFGIIALIFAPMSNSDDATAADEAGAARRQAVREAVDAAQAEKLAFVEGEETAQVPPSRIFAQVGAKLAASKPAAVKTEAQKVAPANQNAEEDSSADEETETTESSDQ
ncbi:hypothetical protein [Roseibacillus ishigakijimensis]|uniref:Uncharacterized protein n=1 Tax=Roseibacillus ishigakijimensis TaxID=454146 RepID=A0A934RT07_9BACT|nr:hypothetical protein [Roseibacillus ishigakijimensis]MBK1834898.1 hypothetical protein [Roseibacillus ishigakijimensis]